MNYILKHFQCSLLTRHVHFSFLNPFHSSCKNCFSGKITIRWNSVQPQLKKKAQIWFKLGTIFRTRWWGVSLRQSDILFSSPSAQVWCEKSGKRDKLLRLFQPHCKISSLPMPSLKLPVSLSGAQRQTCCKRSAVFNVETQQKASFKCLIICAPCFNSSCVH